jgi:hypothetical protein
MKPRPRKGLQDIVCRSSFTSDADNPQRKFLKVANLELRKSLCNKVREAAIRRVREMERQLAEIEQEQARLLQAVQLAGQGEPLTAGPTDSPGQSAPAGGHVLTMKY